MANLDERKLQKLTEASGWIEQARKYYAAWAWQFGDDCIKRARASLADSVFDRQPIEGFPRDAQPEVLWVKNPLTNGKMLINSVDFDPAVHVLWREPEPPNSTKRNK